MINVVTEIMKWLSPPKVGSRPKTQEEKEPSPITFLLQHDYPRCYKYCVDTHKYNVIGSVIDEEIVFDKVYPLRDTHMFRAYQYTFFIQVDGNYKTFIPKNVLRQIPYHVPSGESTSYVIGYMTDKDEVFYYDQYLPRQSLASRIQGD